MKKPVNPEKDSPRNPATPQPLGQITSEDMFYSLKVADSGDWELLAAKTKLNGGKVPFSADAWHNLKLAFFENTISVAIDGAQVARIEEKSFDHGNFGSGWHGAQFANIAIRQELPTERSP